MLKITGSSLEEISDAMIAHLNTFVKPGSAIGLCGGRSIKPVLESLNKHLKAEAFFFQVDERLESDDTNASLLTNFSFDYLPLGQENKSKYQSELSSRPVVNFLGVGEDGHIASLFPGQEHSSENLVIEINNSPKPPPKRLSVSAEVIKKADINYLMFFGEGKKGAYQKFLAGDNSLPCTIATEANKIVVGTYEV